MATKGFFNAFDDVWMLDGVRTPMVDYCGALGHISPTDLGIKAAREALKRAGVPASDIGSVVSGNMAPGDFDQFFLPRHISLYAGVPLEVPSIMVQRICGTGFELFRQAGEHVQGGQADAALVVGTESMTRNPIAAFDHRTGFKLGAPVGFKDYMWEALKDPTAGINMIQTAENLAKKYGITREAVDQFASDSFAKAVAAQQAGFHAGEIVPVVTEKFELDGYKPRGIKLQGKLTEVAQDTHAAHLAGRGAGQAQARLRRRRADRRQQLGAGRCGGGGGGGFGRLRQSTRQEAAGAPGGGGGGGRAARDHGHRPGAGDPPAAGARRPHAGPDRPLRDQRSPGRADPGRGPRTRPGPQQTECQWRRHCAGPSAGLHRRAPDDHRWRAR
jgi:hypothetical protein